MKTALRFTFSWAEPSGDEFFELFRTLDVGAGGALVTRHDENSPLPGVGVEGEFAFNVEHREIRAMGVVTRSTSEGFALRFRLGAAAEDRVAAWVFRQQAKRRT